METTKNTFVAFTENYGGTIYCYLIDYRDIDDLYDTTDREFGHKYYSISETDIENEHIIDGIVQGTVFDLIYG